MLTPKEIGGSKYRIPYAGIVTAVSSTQTLPTQATVSLWYLDAGELVYGHVHIQKDGTIVVVTIGDTVLTYTGTIGATYDQLIKNVLTNYFGEWTSAWAEVVCAEGLLSSDLFSKEANGTFNVGDTTYNKRKPIEVVVPPQYKDSADLCVGGTAVSSPAYSVASKAFDGSLTTYWQANVDGNGSWIGYLFGGPHTVKRFRYRTYNANSNLNNPSSVRFDYTTDGGTSWLQGEVFTDMKMLGVWLDKSLAIPVACNGFRIVSTEGLTVKWIVMEVEAFEPIEFTYGDSGSHLRFANASNLGEDSAQAKTESVYSSNLCTGGSPFASSAAIGGYPLAGAFDGVSGGGNANWYLSSARAPQWVAYDFISPVEIQRVRFLPHVAQPDRCGLWRVEYSDDKSSWTEAHSATRANGDVTWGIGEWDSVGSHRYWRHQIVNHYSHPDNYPLWQEVEFFEKLGMQSSNSWTITGTQTRTTPTS
ncbi:MAG: discoidin domain-containing protein [Pseudodesulfovibrio sp.]|nr:discoidin domain-containing protein [Pseudodesulfovibrio sp.]